MKLFFAIAAYKAARVVVAQHTYDQVFWMELRFRVWNRAQVLVDCLEVLVRHVLIQSPRHNLKQRPELRVRIIKIAAGAHDLNKLIKGETCRTIGGRLRRQIARGERPELFSSGEKVRDVDFEALVAVLDPDLVVRADVVPEGAPREVRGALAWAKGALAFSNTVRFARPALVNGVMGVVFAPRGRLLRALSLIITHGKIAQIDVVADPARLRELDLAVLND
jgi:hypothetical protein